MSTVSGDRQATRGRPTAVVSVAPAERSAAWAAVSAGTALAILAGSLIVLLQPLYLHPALDFARSADWLGVTPGVAHTLSDRTVGELIAGPGTFAFAGPGGERFYDVAEAGHMSDVRIVLIAFLVIVAVVSVLGFAILIRARRSAWAWRAMARGGGVLAVGLLVAGVLSIVAFDAVFELFHRLLFPGGNYTFDPSRQRLVQLYPTAFWQLTSLALGALAMVGGTAAWWLGRRRAAAIERRAAEQAS